MTVIDNTPAMVATRKSRALSNAQLATALDHLHHVKGADRKALLAEASRRLRWADVYAQAAE
jgi:hypothetical protein